MNTGGSRDGGDNCLTGLVVGVIRPLRDTRGIPDTVGEIGKETNFSSCILNPPLRSLSQVFGISLTQKLSPKLIKVLKLSQSKNIKPYVKRNLLPYK